MARLKHEDAFEIILAAPAAGYKAHQLLDYQGHTWIAQGIIDKPEGENMVFRRNVVIEITKENLTDLFAVGDTAAYISASDTAALAGAGDFDISGKVRKASSATDKTVVIALGE